MSDNTKIAWAEASWNPVVGCSKISPGCANCYAEKMACRLARMGQRKYLDVVNVDADEGNGWCGITSIADRSEWDKPRHWKKPRRIFVSSMGDLCHETARYENWRDVVGVATDCPQHTFLILTKRAKRLQQWATDCHPTPNMWLGVTVEDQERANERLAYLRDTPACKRFVSYEPAIGKWDPRRTYTGNMNLAVLDWLDLVIIGGESGHKARPFDMEWARDIIDQCRSKRVSVYMKQLGSKPSIHQRHDADRFMGPWNKEREFFAHTQDRAGADPREWPCDLQVREWPEVAP
jgi:protein gp37